MVKRRIKPRPVGRPGVPIQFYQKTVRNAPPEEFRKQVLEFPLLAYEVEKLKDGRKILVTKPGGKSADNIMVWVYEGPEGAHWRPSHKLLQRDLEEKLAHDKEKGLAIIEALEKIFNGTEPEDILEMNPQLGKDLPGLPVDLILKAYKWIWAQEDCNYPPPRFEGRKMSMREIQEIKERYIRCP